MITDILCLIYEEEIAIMRKLYENAHIFCLQKRVVSAETICGNTVISEFQNHLQTKSDPVLHLFPKNQNLHYIRISCTWCLPHVNLSLIKHLL